MTASTHTPMPSTSRCLKAVRALGIATLGTRRTALGHTAASNVIVASAAAPSELGDLESIGYRHGANVTQSELKTLKLLGWFELDHWVATELAAALRRAGRTLTTTNPFVSVEARRLAHSAALGQIDVLRTATHTSEDRPQPDPSMAHQAFATEPVGAATRQTVFRGGC